MCLGALADWQGAGAAGAGGLRWGCSTWNSCAVFVITSC